MSTRPPSLKVSLDQVRAFWHRKQGLDRKTPDPVAAVVSTGWARTLGGVDVYLAVRERCPGVTRARLEEAVLAGSLRVVPAVRGCIYLVPERDVALVMTLAADLARPRTERDLDKAGSSWREVEEVAAEVSKVLAAGPASTPAIRKALPEDAVRSLGPAGKKVGLSSVLPVALRELEFRREIERLPIDGRLDSERYTWRRVEAVESADVPVDEAGRKRRVAERFFEFFGPATVKELSTWVGISQRDAKAAMAGLDLTPVQAAGLGQEAWVLTGERDALVSAEVPERPFSFLPFEDNLLTVHGGPGVLADPAHHEVPVLSWGRAKPATLGKAKHLHYRPLLHGERLVGFWEYDPEAGEVVVSTFETFSRADAAALDKARSRTAGFVRDELGHARSFSLDTDDGVRKRAAAIRQMS